MNNPIEDGRVLLMSDDGINSMGVALLLNCLKKSYPDESLIMAVTEQPQSGVGGMLSYPQGCDWEVRTVNGVKTICAKGSPVDATEIVSAHADIKKPFDLGISGINIGPNLGTTLFTSGTVNAAISALRLGVIQRAIAISWDVSPEVRANLDLAQQETSPYQEYPGDVVCNLIGMCIEQEFWGATLLNVNLPSTATHQAKITRLTNDMHEVYNKKEFATKGRKGHHRYGSSRVKNPNLPAEVDARAVADGYISITPIQIDLTDTKIFGKNKRKVFRLGALPAATPTSASPAAGGSTGKSRTRRPAR